MFKRQLPLLFFNLHTDITGHGADIHPWMENHMTVSNYE
jgi:hypothetical protein